MKCYPPIPGIVVTVIFAQILMAYASEPEPGAPSGFVNERHAGNPETAGIADSANVFARELFGEFADDDGNLFFSPFSVTAALAMTCAGAAGETKREMASVLRLPGDDQVLHSGWEEILESLTRGAEAGGNDLSIANRLWGQEGYRFKEKFLAIASEHYGAPVEWVDFIGSREAARGEINDWVADLTGETISEIIPESAIDPYTTLILANAIYFRGSWEKPFKKMRTGDREFTLTNGNSVQIPMMTQTADFQYAKIDEADVQILEMPYQSDQISMIILLPREKDGLAALEDAIVSNQYESWFDRLEKEKVELHLPRFQYVCRKDLKETLRKLGMPTAFSPGSADFSAMNENRELFLSEVFHKGYIDVNEKGTEAAAATGVVVTRLCIPIPSTPVIFRADHPFLFLIRDNVTGMILFIGRMADPSMN